MKYVSYILLLKIYDIKHRIRLNIYMTKKY